MVRGVITGVVGLTLLGVIAATAGLVWTHLTVEQARGPLPLVSDLIELGKEGDLPVKVSVIETARQPMPRSAVLDGSRDPHPDAAYIMTYPAFVVQWADGRLLLIDAGMRRERALEFGKLTERLGSAGPLEPLAVVANALGDAAPRVQAMVFTHLHVDHVDGLAALCPRIGHPVKVFMTPAQAEVWTFTTSEGIRIVNEAGCAERARLASAPLMPLPGFPGVAVIAAGGHTPGSEIIAVAVADGGTVRRYLFTGDITNTIDGIRNDIPKPFLYRLIMVPEDDERLGELRRYLRAVERDQGITLVVSHDEGYLESLGIPAWGH